MSKEMYCKVAFHYENVPKMFQKLMRKSFIKNRHAVVDIFNNLIDSVNKEWDLTGKPAMLGDSIEDINPEYIKLIKERIQPAIDVLNKRKTFCKFKIDDVGDLVGYLPFVKRSKLFITLYDIEER